MSGPKKPTGVAYVPSIKNIKNLLDEILKCEFIAHHMNKMEQFKELLGSNHHVFENDKTAEGLYAESKGMIAKLVSDRPIELKRIIAPNIADGDVVFNDDNVHKFLNTALDLFDQAFQKDIEDDAIQSNLIETVSAWLETRITNLKAEKEAFWIQLIEAKEELVKEKAYLDWVLDECSVEYDPEPTTLDVRNRDAIKRYMEPS